MKKSYRLCAVTILCSLMVNQQALANFVYAYVDSGGQFQTDFGDTVTPAIASISVDSLAPGRNLEFNGDMAIGYLGFKSVINAGGDMTASANGTGAINGRAYGEIQDTLTFNSGVGSGKLLLPWHIDGSVETSLSTSAGFVPGPFDGGAITLEVLWQAYPPGGSTTVAGQRFNYSFRESTTVDLDLLLEIPFTFGQTLDYRIYFDFGAIFGYSGNGTTGLLQGYATGLFDQTGTLGTAMIVDLAGNPLPDAILSSASGINYLASPVPLPAAIWLFGSAVLGLASIARRKRALDV